MTARAVERNGLPKMIGTDASSSISRITKSTRKMNLSILTNRKREYGMRLMLAPKSIRTSPASIGVWVDDKGFYRFNSKLPGIEGWWGWMTKDFIGAEFGWLGYGGSRVVVLDLVVIARVGSFMELANLSSNLLLMTQSGPSSPSILRHVFPHGGEMEETESRRILGGPIGLKVIHYAPKVSYMTDGIFRRMIGFRKLDVLGEECSRRLLIGGVILGSELMKDEASSKRFCPAMAKDLFRCRGVTLLVNFQGNIFERITRTKRSKNSQKPTRNERDKNKSEESAKDQSRISPTQKERKSKTPIEVKGLKVTSSQSLKGLFEVLEFKGPKLPKVEKRFIKEEKEEENTRTDYAIFKLPL
ncbi:hypothetical protein Tco_0567117 [Tanacetum coccineum]